MSKKTYVELLRDPRWQKKRLEVLQSKDWACEACGVNDETLHVHHKHYVQHREPWDYENIQLVVLCERCHQYRHEADKDFHALLACVDVSGMPGDVGDLYWLIAGFINDGVTPDLHSQKALYKIGQAASEGCWSGFEGVEV